MSIKVWSFLVTRNLYIDYRTVVAPDFICEAQISNLLARATDGDLTSKGTAICRKILDSSVGDLTLVFQIIKGTKADIQVGEETTTLKDRFGREIYIIEGLVFQGISMTPAITCEVMTAVHSQLREAHREFWEFTEPCLAKPSTAFVAKPSTAFELKDFNTSGELLILNETEPFRANQSLLSYTNWKELTPKQSFKSKFPVCSIAFSSDAQYLVSRTDTQIIQQWDLNNFSPPKTLFEGDAYADFPSTVVVHPNGELIVSGTYINYRNSIWIWNNCQNKEENPLYEKGNWEPDFKRGTLLTVAFSPDGTMIAAGSKYGNIIIWNIHSNKNNKTILADGLSEVRAIHFTPNGELISGEKNGSITIWFPKDKLKYPPLVTGLSPINSLSCSPDGKFLAIGCDESLEVWDLKNQTHFCSAKKSVEIKSVAFSPDSQIIVLGSEDGTLSLFDIKKKQDVLTIDSAHEGEIREVSFNSKNKILASCSKDGTIKLWQY